MPSVRTLPTDPFKNSNSTMHMNGTFICACKGVYPYLMFLCALLCLPLGPFCFLSGMWCCFLVDDLGCMLN